jgi:YihY family inner membrane protein
MLMNWMDRAVSAADSFQARRPWTAVPVAVWRKFLDDQANYLAALVTYFAFVAIFPLLLIFATVLDMTVKNNPELHRDLLNSALMQYPVIGEDITNNLGSVSGTGLPLSVGIVVLLLGARGVAFAMQNALCQVWGIPRDRRPVLWKRWLYALALLVSVGVGLVVTSFLSGIAGGAGHVLSGFGAYLGAVAVSLTLNIALFWLAFRLAVMRMVRWRNLWLGAVLAAVTWQVLQVAGGYLVTHQLHRSSALYGTFGVVLGLLGWLYLQAIITVYCAEVDAVLAGRRWPRSLFGGDAPHESGEPGKAPPVTVHTDAVHTDAVHTDAVHTDAVHTDAVHTEAVHQEAAHTQTLRTEAQRDSVRGDSSAA